MQNQLFKEEDHQGLEIQLLSLLILKLLKLRKAKNKIYQILELRSI